MSVYVDRASILWRGKRWYHMYADSLAELHTLADQIGLQRSWFQEKGLPHYDVTGRMVERAISSGAVRVGGEGESDPYRELRRRHARGEYT